MSRCKCLCSLVTLCFIVLRNCRRCYVNPVRRFVAYLAAAYFTMVTVSIEVPSWRNGLVGDLLVLEPFNLSRKYFTLLCWQNTTVVQDTFFKYFKDVLKCFYSSLSRFGHAFVWREKQLLFSEIPGILRRLMEFLVDSWLLEFPENFGPLFLAVRSRVDAKLSAGADCSLGGCCWVTPWCISFISMTLCHVCNHIFCLSGLASTAARSCSHGNIIGSNRYKGTWSYY